MARHLRRRMRPCRPAHVRAAAELDIQDPAAALRPPGHLAHGRHRDQVAAGIAVDQQGDEARRVGGEARQPLARSRLAVAGGGAVRHEVVECGPDRLEHR